MKRRNAIKGLTLLPFGGMVGGNLLLKPFAPGPDAEIAACFTTSDSRPTQPDRTLTPGDDIYQSIGVEPFINCRGTYSIIGGSIERPEVRAAMESASRHFVQYDELAEGVGKRLAALTGAEWGMVSSGCSGVLKLVTVACVTGGDPEKLQRIPDLTGFEKDEVIIPKESHSAYDFSIQNVGVRIIRVGTLEEFREALGPRTALIKLSGGSLLPESKLGLKEIVSLAAPSGVPVLADAAAEILTVPNVHLQRGADLVAYSGGKVLCGPQCAGLVLGRKDILMSAWQASSPHHGPGRDNKVGREEMMGMLAAVENWITRNHEADWKLWVSWMQNIARKVSAIESVKTEIIEPTGLGNRSPKLDISWDPYRLNLTGDELSEILISTKPRITLGAKKGAKDETTSVSVVAFQMQPGEDEIVANRIFEILSQKRNPRVSAQPKAASADISGRWDVTIKYPSSNSLHSWSIQQSGHRITGVHNGTFSVRDVSGTIDGDQIKLVSLAQRPSPTFIFWGTLSEDTISGQINMGEYLNATFVARRHSYTGNPNPVVIPKGHIMAS